MTKSRTSKGTQQCACSHSRDRRATAQHGQLCTHAWLHLWLTSICGTQASVAHMHGCICGTVDVVLLPCPAPPVYLLTWGTTPGRPSSTTDPHPRSALLNTFVSDPAADRDGGGTREQEAGYIQAGQRMVNGWSKLEPAISGRGVPEPEHRQCCTDVAPKQPPGKPPFWG
jgi:hypothetical protein